MRFWRNLKGVIVKMEERLNGSGRILIRKSGTEPLIRVMAEGKDLDEVKDAVGVIMGSFS